MYAREGRPGQKSNPPGRPFRSASRPARVETAISGGIREPMLIPIGRCTRAIFSGGTPSPVSAATCGPAWCGLPMMPIQRALVASASRRMTPSSDRVVGEDHVRAVVEVVGDRGDQREPEGGGSSRARLVRLEQQATEPHVGAIPEQIAGDRRGEDSDQRPFGRDRTTRGGDGIVGYRAGRVIVVVVRVLSHTASLPS